MKKFYLPSFALFIVLLLFGSVSAQENGSAIPAPRADDERVYKQSEVDQKAKIFKRHHPRTDNMCSSDTGSVRVSIVLHKSGKVSDVKLLESSDCERFNENSLDSARRIKFNPAVKDGQPVSVSVIIEFMYRRG
ncbi:MAG TPA: energy transducer TonB [Pyrinomonadaceae bacterium]|nr:energy transducer TonB [Pyrinomonadaceae bacterium]